MAKSELHIAHGQDSGDQLVPVDSLDIVEAEDAIQALQAKMASYPLPTAAVSKMTPPVPTRHTKDSTPQTSQPSNKAAPTAKSQSTTPKTTASQQTAAATQQKKSKSKTRVVAESPTELKIIHEKG